MHPRGALVVRGSRVALSQSPRPAHLAIWGYWEDRGLSTGPGHLHLSWYTGIPLFSLGRCHLRWQKEASLAPSPELQKPNGCGLESKEEREGDRLRRPFALNSFLSFLFSISQ